MKFDTIVLGAGIIGVSIAAHLQKRGRSVALVDIRQPGCETSFGNAGLIQREGVYPYALPRGFRTLLHYARNQSPEIRYHPNVMLKLAPFLWKYWCNSRPSTHAAIAHAYAPLIEHCVTEHRALADAAGVSELLRSTGWMKVFRTAAQQDQETLLAESWLGEFGIEFDALDAARLRQTEPNLDPSLVGGLRYTASVSVSDPNALVTAYAKYFEQLGGRFFVGDGTTLKDEWKVDTHDGQIQASSVVLAMGPWADLVTSRLGYRFPLAVKRGYHMHYETGPGARLNHPILDLERGYMITPMARGIRLTTGAELANRDAPPTPVQLSAVEPIARTLFPLGARIDSSPWMGSRPCTPDMMPIIGPAPRHQGLWFAFGHAHHGFTLGAVTGRLVAEMITKEPLLLDPYPFRPSRFNA